MYKLFNNENGETSSNNSLWKFDERLNFDDNESVDIYKFDGYYMCTLYEGNPIYRTLKFLLKWNSQTEEE